MEDNVQHKEPWDCLKCKTKNEFMIEINHKVQPFRPRIIGKTICSKCCIDRFSKTYYEFWVLAQVKKRLHPELVKAI